LREEVAVEELAEAGNRKKGKMEVGEEVWIAQVWSIRA